MSELWQRLRTARRYADLTQTDLGRACGVSRSAVAFWESETAEQRTRPTLEHMVTISTSTGAPLEWLMNDASRLEDLLHVAEAPARPAGAAQAAPVSPGRPAPRSPDPLPELRHGDALFVFAHGDAQSIAQKLERLLAEPAGVRTHLIIVAPAGQAAPTPSLHVAASPEEALAMTVQLISQPG